MDDIRSGVYGWEALLRPEVGKSRNVTDPEVAKCPEWGASGRCSGKIRVAPGKSEPAGCGEKTKRSATMKLQDEGS